MRVVVVSSTPLNEATMVIKVPEGADEIAFANAQCDAAEDAGVAREMFYLVTTADEEEQPPTSPARSRRLRSLS